MRKTSDPADIEAARLLNRLRGLAVVHAVYSRMLTEQLEPAERRFAQREVRRLLGEMHQVRARIQAVAQAPDGPTRPQ